MNRYRTVPLVLFFFAFSLLLASSWSQAANVITKHPPGKPNVKPIRLPKPLEKILAREYIATVALRDCPAGQKPIQPAAGVGGFGCSMIYPIELSVRQNDNKVVVSPEKLRGVKQGDCIQWKTKSDDGVTAKILSINFLDTATEASNAGKASTMVSTYAVGADVCADSGPLCVVSIALADGTYPYEVTVLHGTTRKKADPEIEVECGSHCGDPEDLPR